MKKISITFCILFTVYLTVAQPAKVAILESMGNVSNDIKTIIREELTVAMVNQPKQFEILERAVIDQVIKEQQIELSGEMKHSQICALGKKLGVNYVCVSSVTPMEQHYYIVVKLVTVSTELIKSQVNQMSPPGLDNLYKTAQNIGQKLAAEYGTERGNIPTEKVLQNSLISPVTDSSDSTVPITYEEFYYKLSKERETLIKGNQQALETYKKYKSYRTAGWWLFGTGVAAGVGGGIIMSFSSTGGGIDGVVDKQGIASGIIITSLGSIATVTGLIFLIAKPYLKTTYNYYIQGGTKQSLHLDFNPIVSSNYYGAGLTVRF